MDHGRDVSTKESRTTSVSILLDSSDGDIAARTVAHTTTLPIHVLSTETGAVIAGTIDSAELTSEAKSTHLSITNVKEVITICNMTGSDSETPVVFIEPGMNMNMFDSKGAKPTLKSASSSLTTSVNFKQGLCSDADNLCTSVTTATIPMVITGSSVNALASITEKSDLSPALSSLSAPLMTETAVLVETSRGLMLSVGDDMRAVTYSNLSDGADTQSGHLLTIGSNCIPVTLLSQCQQGGLMEEHGAGVVFEAGEEVEGEGDHVVTREQGAVMCTTSLPLVTQQMLTVSSPDGEEPKKNRGWPKGKRRKAVPEVHGPRAPMTGYVLFAINRRQQIKQSHPQLPFTEVTKILGQEWSCMSADKKQKYLEEAELDKQRYIEELKEFQQSDAYQTLVKKKRLKGGESGDDAFGVSTDVEDEADELHCRVCSLYFSSLHNKKEHMFGRQHLQAITDQLEKELKKQQKQQELAQQQDAQFSASADLSPAPEASLSELGDSLESTKLSRPVDLSSFIVGFVQKNYERDQEIQALRRILRRDVQENWSICKQIQDLKEYESKLRQDVKTLSAHMTSLSTQINGLKTVPALFGVVEF